MANWRIAVLAIAVLVVPFRSEACRLALALAIDVSTSVDQRDYTLQRNGLANAIRSPEVKDAFLSSGMPVAIAAFEWSGPHNQRVILDWTLMTSAEIMEGAADRIESIERFPTGFPTSLGNALSFGAEMMSSAPGCERFTVDVSGDGRNNNGYPPEVAYRDPAFVDIGVNALAIGGSEPLGSLVEYFRESVIRGNGAFVEVARNHEEFEAAMRRKLIREVTVLVMSQVNNKR